MEKTPLHMPNSVGSNVLNFHSGTSVRIACPDAKENKLVIPGSAFVGSEVSILHEG
jgi:hypothetical protein